ncbi:MAG: D-tyrosyl-tRNA(Tyr) deacylase [Rhodobacter sp.]|uniref:D-aminoacyl-tRNA deacylase n=1 Tax=Pararhodobacter sp. TaxID=2127056 RepID=UPI001DDF75D4|nr:D-aminoacyl-tRNA deacylase [Pararhodobacter sp.]MCB1346171.1 D-tyrosyl-tRNA(Tyr) deacylase [Paracoccaceae bacterium]MCC0073625.1 D-tyrosyl-tRNA(Tyr) deacylase [Rhodobacter sp.]HPD91736.1 D-aminoacyl-tRNA deacylase [Pararhodobacter sp.]
MRALIQRVTRASVAVDGAEVGACGPGLMILVCAMQGDGPDKARALADKILKLRIFRDDSGKTNRALADVGGGALVVSQFTLAADTSRGNRPGFSQAAPPDEGRTLYELFADHLAAQGVPVGRGVFGAEMEVTLVNDGPMTIWLDL